MGPKIVAWHGFWSCGRARCLLWAVPLFFGGKAIDGFLMVWNWGLRKKSGIYHVM